MCDFKINKIILSYNFLVAVASNNFKSRFKIDLLCATESC